MFWKKKRVATTISPRKADRPFLPPEPPKDPYEVAVDDLTASLRQFRKQFVEYLKPGPDQELLEAKRIVKNANKILRDGGIGMAISIVLHEIQHWPTWSKITEFTKYINFPAEDVSGDEGPHLMLGKKTIRFSFKGRKWIFLHDRRAYSHEPDDPDQAGHLEICVDGSSVFRSNMYCELGSEHWQHSTLEALQVGDWMQDLIEMSVLAQKGFQKRTDSLFDDAIREAAKSIKL